MPPRLRDGLPDDPPAGTGGCAGGGGAGARGALIRKVGRGDVKFAGVRA